MDEPKRRFRIQGQKPLYRLLDDSGAVIAEDPNPRKLSTQAFARGAQEVSHDYDLREAD